MNEIVRGARIAHLIESDGPGGAEQMLAHLAGALAHAGCDCLAVVPANGEGWLARQLGGTGVSVEEIRLDGPASTRCIRDLATMLRKRRIDLVHSHEFTMAVYGAWAARRAGIPHVITMHGGRYYASRIYRRLALRAAIRASGGAVAVSANVSRWLRHDLRLGARFVSVIPNGVRPAPDVPGHLRAELGLAPHDRLVVAVGNLYAVKGHVHLVDALAVLADDYPHVHLAIAGRGELRDALARHAAARGIETRVHLLGYRADIPNILASADVFALPSLSEGLPLALLEAMFHGLPVVAANVGELADVIGPKAGITVPPGDPERLALALRLVLGDAAMARRMGDAARSRATAEFDIRRTVEQYAEVYARHLTSSNGDG